MTPSLAAEWHRIREIKGSNIVAGLDPALYEMGRGEQGLLEGADFESWCVDFIDAVAPYVAGIKPNIAYFSGASERMILERVVKHAKQYDVLVISDNKISDIGSTNDAYFFYNKRAGFDCVTCAPYAGNIESSVERAHANDLPIILMGLMSNPEYQSEMHFTDPQTGEALWHSRTRRCLEAGADGVVVGGTYTTKDKAFMEFVTLTDKTELLYLIPGIGAQGGEVAAFLESGIDPHRCMINSGRAVMFPNGSASTPPEQAEAVKELRDSFNSFIELKA